MWVWWALELDYRLYAIFYCAVSVSLLMLLFPFERSNFLFFVVKRRVHSKSLNGNYVFTMKIHWKPEHFHDYYNECFLHILLHAVNLLEYILYQLFAKWTKSSWAFLILKDHALELLFRSLLNGNDENVQPLV